MADPISLPTLISVENGRWLVGNRDGHVFDAEVYPNKDTCPPSGR
jgi:hypothetical protein